MSGDPLETSLGYRFRDPGLLGLALTHRSYSNEHGGGENFERLEFLGDSVLGLVAARWLYERFPQEPEGRLAKLKSYLVSAPVLAAHAETIGVGKKLRLGVGEARSGGRRKASILADALESLFGAIYLDGGFDAARGVIEPVLERALEARKRLTDSKTRLQEHAQGRGWGLPVYRVVSEVGPDHDKLFTVECALGDLPAQRAEGRSKKEAEQRAAAAVLGRLDPARGAP